jgi:hypothetical protein
MATSRRRFLIGAGAAGGALAIGAVAAPAGRDAVPRASLQRIASALPEWAHARDIGVEYLRRDPTYAAGDRLGSLLADVADRFSLTGSAEDQLRRVVDQIAADYEDGEVVNFGGWLLSQTAVRLCALSVAVSEGQAGVHGAFAPSVLPSPLNHDRFSWLTPEAAFVVRTSEAPFDVRLRSGARFSQTVAIQYGDKPSIEVVVSGPNWRGHQIDVGGQTVESATLRITTTPSWTPTNDFRTIGVGVGVAPWNSW